MHSEQILLDAQAKVLDALSYRSCD